MVTTKITFEDHTIQPPVFVAGTFTKWEPVLLASSTDGAQNGSKFYHEKTFDLSPGQHQFKFLLGDGQWWVCDETKPTALDSGGNTNNLITIEKPDEPEEPEKNNIAIPRAVPEVHPPASVQNGDKTDIESTYNSKGEPDRASVKEPAISNGNPGGDPTLRRSLKEGVRGSVENVERPLGFTSEKTVPFNGSKEFKTVIKANIGKKTDKKDDSKKADLLNEKKDTEPAGGFDGTNDEAIKITSTPQSGVSPKPIEDNGSIGRSPNPIDQGSPLDSTEPKSETASSTAPVGGNDEKRDTIDVAEGDNKPRKEAKVTWFQKLTLRNVAKNLAVLIAVVVAPLLVSWFLYR